MDVDLKQFDGDTNLDFLESLQGYGRYDLFIVSCPKSEISNLVKIISSRGISTINSGYELSKHLSTQPFIHSISIESQDYFSNLVQNGNSKPDSSKSKIVFIYNFGILVDPVLNLDAELIIKNLSKKYKIFLLWENEIDLPAMLHWGVNKEKINLNFNDITPKILKVTHEV